MNYYLCCGNKTGVEDPSQWIGVDINPEVKPDVLADVRELPFEGPVKRVFATPPCDGFTDLPWRPATNKGLEVLKVCFDWCGAAEEWGLLENNRFAQRFIGKASFHRGPHYFWAFGDVPLIPHFYHYKGGTSGLKPLERARLPVILP